MTRAEAFIQTNTAIARAPLVPEIALHLATEITPIWQATEAWLGEQGIEPPFWAFAWPGSQAMARLILDEPHRIAGRRVLDFAAGCGLAAIAAARAGAALVEAAEIDPLADAATRRWLSGYCRRLTVTSDGRRPASAAARGARVAVACWGHPMFSDGLARAVISELAASGGRWSVRGAISPLGSAFARAAAFLGGDYGWQAIQSYSLEAMLAEPDAATVELPLAIHAERAGAARWRELSSALGARYPRGHRAKLFRLGRAHEADEVPVDRLDLGEEGAVLLVPPVEGGRTRR